jgi:hypothetical protein
LEFLRISPLAVIDPPHHKISNNPDFTRLLPGIQRPVNMSPVLLQDEPDSDEDVEFEDVPILHQTSTQNSERTRNGDISIDLPPVPTQQWNPPLYLPPQRTTPIPSGSEEEIQLRGRFSTGIEKITYRKMKSDMGMDAPDTPVSLRRYEGFKDLVVDVDSLVDMLWVSATREYNPSLLFYSHLRLFLYIKKLYN